VEQKVQKALRDRSNLSARSITTSFGLISAAEYELFRRLNEIGTFSKLQLLNIGIPYDIIRNMVKHGLLESVSHPTKAHFRVADGILVYDE
jgi:hypothetical protein